MVALGTAGTASAQLVREPDRVVYEKRTNLDLAGTELPGVLKRPSGEYVHVPARPKFPPLIELRADFGFELARSVSEL